MRASLPDERAALEVHAGWGVVLLCVLLGVGLLLTHEGARAPGPLDPH